MLPLQVIDSFLLNYNIGQALLLLFILATLGALPLKSVVALQEPSVWTTVESGLTNGLPESVPVARTVSSRSRRRRRSVRRQQPAPATTGVGTHHYTSRSRITSHVE